MKGVAIALPVQMDFVFKIRMTLIPIPHRAVNDINIAMLGTEFFQFLGLHQVEPVLMIYYVKIVKMGMDKSFIH